MYDIALVVEKSRYVRQDIVVNFLNYVVNKLSEQAFSRVGLVVFSRYAFPLFDLGYNFSKISKLYSTIPIIQGIPEPSLGLYEAVDMIMELDDGLAEKKIILLIATFATVPRKPIVEAIDYVINSGIELYVLVAGSRKPKYLIDVYPHVYLLKSISYDKLFEYIVKRK